MEIINVFGINCIFKLNEERLTGEVLINSINPFDEMTKNSSSICYPTFKIPVELMSWRKLWVKKNAIIVVVNAQLE